MNPPIAETPAHPTYTLYWPLSAQLLSTVEPGCLFQAPYIVSVKDYTHGQSLINIT